MENKNCYEKYGRAVWVLLTSFLLMKSFISRIFGLSVLFQSDSLSEGIIIMSLGALAITIASLVLFIVSLVKVIKEKKDNTKYFNTMLWVNLGLAIGYFLLGALNINFSSNTVDGTTTVTESIAFLISEGMYLPLMCVIIALAVDGGLRKKFDKQKTMLENVNNIEDKNID